MSKRGKPRRRAPELPRASKSVPERRMNIPVICAGSFAVLAILYWFSSILFGELVWDTTPSSLVLTHALPYQYLSGFLVGLGMGGVVGASTLGVALFSLIAPENHLFEFTAMVPVVNCVSSLATVSVYLKHAEWGLVLRMWPWILVGIVTGTALQPLLHESQLRRLTSIVYAGILLQRIVEKAVQLDLFSRAFRWLTGRCDSSAPSEITEDTRAADQKYYRQFWLSAAVGMFCGVVTVLTNNSGPIFNIYLLACGLDMNQFVASRSVMMAGKNAAKVVARLLSGGLPLRVAQHGIIVGLLSVVGIQVAKPIKKRTSVEFYTYFTWIVLLYTAVNMW